MEVNGKMSKTIAIANQKGGVGKTTTTVNLGIGLANEGKRVLLIDCDAQASLTESLGYRNPDDMDITLSTLMQKVIEEQPIAADEGILHHAEGIDVVPANIELSGMETALINIMNRERVLKDYINQVKSNYDYVLIDCTPSLGMLTVNALTAANEVIIPVQAHFLPAKGLEQLMKTVSKVKRHINPKLKIGGILLTMLDSRTNFAKEISSLIRDTYGKNLKIFKAEIPMSIRAAETSASGKSIYAYDKNGKVAEAYKNLTKEVLDSGKEQAKHRTDLIR
jgi:chromosome partitioning protein